ncbi:hypothetical protein BuS5_03693 [Desulfosarcina sp. BuS5]|uniref:sigma-54-dependent transcriptional regulator n=1 Tax=Desulfosarcina sp. BuS5 TaxID=933262 RepID=UPI000484E12B|nr:sigma-54 dependent transcriptional regulator [Desulfosarcina sp. BuS5]WDN90722.1 hypothetical protein BuS5_03693 [Desulfosarcina sp. BuS5]
MVRILVVDDEEKMRHLLAIMLGAGGYAVDQAPDGEAALNMAASGNYDIIISDIRMPKMDGITLLNRLKEMNLPCPVIFITAFASVDSAVDAMRKGAADYITKPFEEKRILLAVERTLNITRLMSENLALKQHINKITEKDEIISASESMSKILKLAGKVAQRNATVLITGESGVGKEVLAKFIHNKSPRKDEKFIPLNCAAISAGLMESELFGHEKGAYTGADRRTLGKFEYSDKGTLFLDEIGDLPFEAQSKLLRALQDNKIQRVGGNSEIKIDVRVICATNQNLEQLVEDGKFRADLFFRINVFPVHIPTLSERKNDIIPLAEYFLRRFDESGGISLSASSQEQLLNYAWPGNVRELANAIERAVIIADNPGKITSATLSFLNSKARLADKNNNNILLNGKTSLDEIEKNLVQQALEKSNNNQTAAAKLLGITRSRFRVLLKQLN